MKKPNKKSVKYLRRQSRNEIPKLRRKLRIEFNAFIRARDQRKWKKCISCSGPIEQAGHFYSSGAHPNPSMDFNPDNVHGQCIACNYHKHGNLLEYRKGLIRRHGEQLVKKLDLMKSLPRNPWTRFEYETMIDFYKKKNRELTYENEQDIWSCAP
jgi:hypothetical protein